MRTPIQGPGSTLARIEARKTRHSTNVAASSSRPRRWSDRILNWRLTRFLASLEPYGFLIGVIAVLFAAIAIFISLFEARDGRIVSSWQLVTTKAPGNSGKREALQFLNEQYTLLGWTPPDGHWIYRTIPLKARVPLTGIDLSQKTDQAPVYLAAIQLPDADLSKANLSGANLPQADLSGVNLTDAILDGTEIEEGNLSNARLIRASLTAANLTEADLSKANLYGADLFAAILAEVDLSGAILNGADLSAAMLFNANLSGAKFSDTNLSGANLRQAKGLVKGQLDAAWACRGKAPKLPEGFGVQLRTCNKSGRPADYAPI